MRSGKYFERLFNENLDGFWKAHSAQHALLELLASWHKSVDKGAYVDSIIKDLSKTYECLSHDLLLAKRQAYSFSKDSV